MPVETRYHRSDKHTINTLTARKLVLTQSGTAGQIFANFSRNTTFWESDVYVRSSGGTEVQIGSNVATVSRSTVSEGIQSATFNCPETELVPTDAIRVHEKITNGPPNHQVISPGQGSFITEQLGAILLSNATWIFQRYTQHVPDPEGNLSFLRFDTVTFNTRIENFTYNLASTGANNLFFCNG